MHTWCKPPDKAPTESTNSGSTGAAKACDAPAKLIDTCDKGLIYLLRDLLQPDFPEARILSFAHNSDWLVNAPVKTAQQISDKLLKQLVEARKDRLVSII